MTTSTQARGIFTWRGSCISSSVSHRICQNFQGVIPQHTARKMADATITEASLKSAIAERLNAVHVEVTDMSGTFSCAPVPINPILRQFWAWVDYKYFIILRFAMCRAVYCKKEGITINHSSTGGCGQSFTTLIVSPQFTGLNSLKRHRAVNAALKREIAAIHAWSAKCQTPEEWEKDKAKTGGAESKPPLDGTVGGQVQGTNA